MEINAKHLKQKGWTDHEILHAKNIVKKAEKNKHPKVKAFEENVYWLFTAAALLFALFFYLLVTYV